MDDVTLKLYNNDLSTRLELPYSEEGIKAGFPSPAQDYACESIDLNRVLIRHPETTFYARVQGTSMCDAGIDDGDMVIIDKSLEPTDGDYVAAYIDGEFTLKQLHVDAKTRCVWLMPANEAFSPIRVEPESDFMIWGVIVYTIKRMHR